LAQFEPKQKGALLLRFFQNLALVRGTFWPKLVAHFEPFYPIRAKTLDNPQTAKCFIYDVIGRFSFSFVIYVVNSGTSKIIGTLDLNAFPTAIACLNLSVGKAFMYSTPR